MAVLVTWAARNLSKAMPGAWPRATRMLDAIVPDRPRPPRQWIKTVLPAEANAMMSRMSVSEAQINQAG